MGRKQELERRSFEISGLEVRRSEAHEVFGSRQKPATRPLIAIVHGGGRDELAAFRPLVETSAVGNQAVGLVRRRTGHAERLEYVAAHIGQELLSRSTLDHRADQIESVARVREAGSG